MDAFRISRLVTPRDSSRSSAEDRPSRFSESCGSEASATGLHEASTAYHMRSSRTHFARRTRRSGDTPIDPGRPRLRPVRTHRSWQSLAIARAWVFHTCCRADHTAQKCRSGHRPGVVARRRLRVVRTPSGATVVASSFGGWVGPDGPGRYRSVGPCTAAPDLIDCDAVERRVVHTAED